MGEVNWSKKCDCGATVEHWKGERDVSCNKCGQEYNAFGQRLRSGWENNASNYDDDIDDMSGYEDSFKDY